MSSPMELGAPEYGGPEGGAPDPGVSWRPHINAANAVTSAGFGLAVVAILVVLSAGAPVPAPWRWAAAGLVIGAAAADLLDGMLARRSGTHVLPFGHGYDTISDVVSFGVAPAVLAHSAELYRMRVIGALLVLAWCAAADLRLSRYLVRGHQGSYVGCPAPVAAVLLVIMVAAGAAWQAVAAGMAVMAAAMVSNVAVPTWQQLAGKAPRPAASALRVREWSR